MESFISFGSFLVYVVLQLFIWLLVAWAIMSWLVAFNVLNTRNEVVRVVLSTLDRIFAPILRPIRRLLPDLGGVDLSPMVLILLILLVQQVLWPALVRNIVVA